MSLLFERGDCNLLQCANTNIWQFGVNLLPNSIVDYEPNKQTMNRQRRGKIVAWQWNLAAFGLIFAMN
jgi:hypothetical protein